MVTIITPTLRLNDYYIDLAPKTNEETLIYTCVAASRLANERVGDANYTRHQ